MVTKSDTNLGHTGSLYLNRALRECSQVHAIGRQQKENCYEGVCPSEVSDFLLSMEILSTDADLEIGAMELCPVVVTEVNLVLVVGHMSSSLSFFQVKDVSLPIEVLRKGIRGELGVSGYGIGNSFPLSFLLQHIFSFY